MDEDDDLKKQVEETLKYLSFSLKEETETTGTMGFKMQSRSGQDLSFVVTIEKTEDGTIATGQFGDPSNADVLVTVPAEDFVRIYSGEANLSNVTSLILRGKISVRNYDLNGVSRFMNSFEFSSQKWQDYYAYQDELAKREEMFTHLNQYIKNIKNDPIVRLRQSLYTSSLFDDLYNKHFKLPSIHEYSAIKPVTQSRIPSVLSTTSLPSLDEVTEMETLPPQEHNSNENQQTQEKEEVLSTTSLSHYDIENESTEKIENQPSQTPFHYLKDTLQRTFGTSPLPYPYIYQLPSPVDIIQTAISTIKNDYEDVNDMNEPTMFSEDSTVNMWEGIDVTKAFQKLENLFRKRYPMSKNQITKPPFKF